MFYEEQQYRCRTLSQRMSLGPTRSCSKRLFRAVDFSVLAGLVDRSDKVDEICDLIKDK